MKLRAEWFGGIVALERPRALVMVNRPLMRALGLADSPRWRDGGDTSSDRSSGAREGLGQLSAPTEVHLVMSQQCSAGCKSCYVGATPRGQALSLEQAKQALDALAKAGVFHVALGGGEAMELDYLFEVARYAREKGLIPNLTTAGLSLTEAQAQRCTVFGQINVSVDGVGERYRQARGFDGFARAERALKLLRSVKKEVGINCVVSRQSFDHLHEVVALARRLKLNEVEFLRFKPAGRGVGTFEDEDLTPEQARRIFPKAQWLTLRYRMRVKLDCSFAPMVFWHKPSPLVARFFGVVGCEGGNLLASIMPDGRWMGCSFGGPREGSVFDRAQTRQTLERGFTAFRNYIHSAPEPCRSCEYLSLCKGGCRVVAQARGDWWQPDPGCPRVVEHRANS